MPNFKKSLIVPTNWDFELLDFVDKYPEVRDFYGKLKSDLVGGGRASYEVPEKDVEIVKAWVGLCRKKGKNFCYLLNAYCIANKEYDSKFLREVFQFVEWLLKIGVNEVMVTIPYLVKVLKREFPQLKIIASQFCNIHSLKRAKFWEEYGVDEITLGANITRNFILLKKIVSNLNIRVHALTNDACLLNCHLQDSHHLMESHASQEGCQIPYYRYYTTNCRQIFLSNPVEILRSTFIRPEDINSYIKIGIKSFKLTDRNKPTKWIKNVIQAYAKEKYAGNLADLFSLFSWYGHNSKPNHMQDIEVESILNLQTSQSLIPRVFINNQKLDGFLDGFKKLRCEELVCDTGCKYCMQWTEKSLIIDQVSKETVLKNLLKLSKRMETQKFK